MSNNLLTLINKFPNTKAFAQNIFIRGNHYMSEEEKSAIYAILTLLKPFSKNPNDFRISKQPFLKKIDVDPRYGFSLYKKIINGLMQKSVISFRVEGVLTSFAILTYSRWADNESFFDISINNKIMPYLENLKNQFFGIIDFSEINVLSSKYASTLYRQFISYKNFMQYKSLRFNTKQLRDLFLLEEKDYVYGGNFKRHLFEKKTIQRAIEEINQKTTLNVEWTKTKNEDKEVIYELAFRGKNIQEKTTKTNELMLLTDNANNQEKNNIYQQIEKVLEQRGYEKSDIERCMLEFKKQKQKIENLDSAIIDCVNIITDNTVDDLFDSNIFKV